MIHHTSKRWEERLEVFLFFSLRHSWVTGFYLVKYIKERLFDFNKSYPVIFHTFML